MRFDRTEAKYMARGAMRQTRPNPMLVTFVYILLMLPTVIIPRLLGDPANEALEYMVMWGYPVEDVFEYVVLNNISHIAIFSVVSLLLNIYSTVMGFGLTSYGLRLARGEQPGYGNLFDGFAKVLRVLWASILIWLFTFLWSMLFALPVMAVLVVAFMLGAANSYEAIVTLSTAAFFAMVAIEITVSLRYRLAYFFLLDDPDCTAREAVRQSRETMRGWKMELFLLDLSFLGWYLLSVLTFGVLLLWVVPYENAAQANFYDAVTGRSSATPPLPEQGGYSGPYDYRGTDGSGPF